MLWYQDFHFYRKCISVPSIGYRSPWLLIIVIQISPEKYQHVGIHISWSLLYRQHNVKRAQCSVSKYLNNLPTFLTIPLLNINPSLDWNQRGEYGLLSLYIQNNVCSAHREATSNHSFGRLPKSFRLFGFKDAHSLNWLETFRAGAHALTLPYGEYLWERHQSHPKVVFEVCKKIWYFLTLSDSRMSHYTWVLCAVEVNFWLIY